MNSNLVHAGVGGIGTGCDLDLSPFSVRWYLLSARVGLTKGMKLTGTP
jgi:hypothetical protein